MPRATDQRPALLTLAAGAGLLLASKAACRLGWRGRKDGWRRAAGLMLREEASTFVLSAFGLDLWSGAPSTKDHNEATGEQVAARLGAFLDSEPCCRVQVAHGATEDWVEPCARASFTADLQPWVEGPRRFVAPEHWGERAKHEWGGEGCRSLVNAVCRVSAAGAADVWLRINHVGADGAPMQEMLTRLEQAWGLKEAVVYPTPAEFAPFENARALPDRRGWSEAQAFVDFAPLLTWRKRANAVLRDPMPVAAAMLWCLAQESALTGACCGSTVEVSATDGLERGVGVVVLRPADYSNDLSGLGRYVRDFNGAVESTRTRTSDGCRTLDAAAHLPPRLARTLLAHALDHTPRAFGDMAVTVLKDAHVFGAPLPATGHRKGFLAIGGMALPATGGGKVGSITVKGENGVVAGYPAMIRAAIRRCDAMPPGI